MNILEQIVKQKKQDLREQKDRLPLPKIKQGIANLPKSRDFLQAISVPGRVNLIAEVKWVSPACGRLVKNFDLKGVVSSYEEAGAAAISVLTEEKYFLGTLENIGEVKEISNLPVLRKDFLFDSYQIYESRCFGADAFLLISAILTREEIEELLCVGHSLGMTALVEIHNEEDLDKVLKTPARVVGINNRNLKDLTVDLKVTPRLRKKIPKDKIVVSESGIRTREDVEFLKKVGINAVLIGQTLIQSKNIPETVKKLGLK